VGPKTYSGSAAAAKKKTSSTSGKERQRSGRSVSTLVSSKSTGCWNQHTYPQNIVAKKITRSQL